MKDKHMKCTGCDQEVYPEYHSQMCVAMYGTVVYLKGYCPVCGKIIVPEHMIDNSGLIPPKEKW